MRASCGTTKNQVMTCITINNTLVDHNTESGCMIGPDSDAIAIRVPTQNTIRFAKRRPRVSPDNSAPTSAAATGITITNIHDKDVGSASCDRLTSKGTPQSTAIPNTMRHNRPDQIPVTNPAYSKNRTLGLSAFGGAIGVTERSHGREVMDPLCRMRVVLPGGGLPKMRPCPIPSQP